MIPVLGFATLSRFDLAQRLLDSIDYPIEHLVIIDNSGKKEFQPKVNSDLIKNLWLIQVPFGLGATGAWNLIIKSTPHAPYWVIPNDDSYFEPGALRKIAENVDPDAFNFVDVQPKWSCVVPGEGAVIRAGLWDEAFYPLYFDDNDYENRLKAFGVKFNEIAAKIRHDNSSTLHSGYKKANAITYGKNNALYQKKVSSNNTDVIGWKLQIRRDNSWD